MVNFSVDQIRGMMDKQNSIRNISVIAHVDHGKSTLTDSLIGKAGIIAEAKQGEARFMDTRDDEQARSITIKSTCVSLYYELADELDATNKTPYLINLIDSPGHVDFSSEVTAALRVTDGALVVVDCVEGVCVQTETVLRQAIAERIKPVLFLNKLDRVFLELQCTAEEAYQNFRQATESVNVVIATYMDDVLGDIQVDPTKGQVGFGSGLHAWGFTLDRFALMYASKFGVKKEKMMKRLWGDKFYNPKTKKWQRDANKNSKTTLQRGFVQFIMGPMKQMVDAIMEEKPEIYEKMFKQLDIVIPKADRELMGKPLMKVALRTWLPAGDALLGMIVKWLPSPAVAQKYRADNLYSGPSDDKYCEAIRNCDAEAEPHMYISKMVPTSEKGRFYAFGRVFAGTIKTGQSVRICLPDYEVGKKKGLYIKKIQRTVLMMGRYTEQIADVPAGNMLGLVGVDQFIQKTATLCGKDAAECHPFNTMKFSVSAVVRVAVEPRNAQDLPKLVEGLKRLGKSDPLVKISHSKTGEHIIAGAGELHLEICLKDLEEQYMKGAALKVSEPVVSYAESISEVTGTDEQYPKMCVSKSPNKHNRLYLWGEPLDRKLCLEIEAGDVNSRQDNKVRARYLADEYGWDVTFARKIWTFGCKPEAEANFLVDATKAVQYLSEIKDSFVGAFMQATSGGVFCDEVMRGIRFNIDDVTLHADAIHRGAGQIMPCATRVMKAVQIASGPILLEPVYIVNITVPQQAVSGCYSTLNSRRGNVEDKVDRIGTPLTQLKAFLPVAESFGFTQLLRKNTSGQAFPQMSFSHWQEVNGSPFDEGSSAERIVLAVRKRKGLREGLPVFGDYYDRV